MGLYFACRNIGEVSEFSKKMCLSAIQFLYRIDMVIPSFLHLCTIKTFCGVRMIYAGTTFGLLEILGFTVYSILFVVVNGKELSEITVLEKIIFYRKAASEFLFIFRAVTLCLALQFRVLADVLLIYAVIKNNNILLRVWVKIMYVLFLFQICDLAGIIAHSAIYLDVGIIATDCLVLFSRIVIYLVMMSLVETGWKEIENYGKSSHNHKHGYWSRPVYRTMSTRNNSITSKTLSETSSHRRTVSPMRPMQDLKNVRPTYDLLTKEKSIRVHFTLPEQGVEADTATPGRQSQQSSVKPTIQQTFKPKEDNTTSSGNPEIKNVNDVINPNKQPRTKTLDEPPSSPSQAPKPPSNKPHTTRVPPKPSISSNTANSLIPIVPSEPPPPDKGTKQIIKLTNDQPSPPLQPESHTNEEERSKGKSTKDGSYLLLRSESQANEGQPSKAVELSAQPSEPTAAKQPPARTKMPSESVLRHDDSTLPLRSKIESPEAPKPRKPEPPPPSKTRVAMQTPPRPELPESVIRLDESQSPRRSKAESPEAAKPKEPKPPPLNEPPVAKQSSARPMLPESVIRLDGSPSPLHSKAESPRAPKPKEPKHPPPSDPPVSKQPPARPKSPESVIRLDDSPSPPHSKAESPEAPESKELKPPSPSEPLVARQPPSRPKLPESVIRHDESPSPFGSKAESPRAPTPRELKPPSPSEPPVARQPPARPKSPESVIRLDESPLPPLHKSKSPEAPKPKEPKPPPPSEPPVSKQAPASPKLPESVSRLDDSSSPPRSKAKSSEAPKPKEPKPPPPSKQPVARKPPPRPELPESFIIHDESPSPPHSKADSPEAPKPKEPKPLPPSKPPVSEQEPARPKLPKSVTRIEDSPSPPRSKAISPEATKPKESKPPPPIDKGQTSFPFSSGSKSPEPPSRKDGKSNRPPGPGTK